MGAAIGDVMFLVLLYNNNLFLFYFILFYVIIRTSRGSVDGVIKALEFHPANLQGSRLESGSLRLLHLFATFALIAVTTLTPEAQ